MAIVAIEPILTLLYNYLSIFTLMKFFKSLILFALILIPSELYAQSGNEKPVKQPNHKIRNHKTAEQHKNINQTPEKRKELLQRTLKEKGLHIPDSSKHK